VTGAASLQAGEIVAGKFCVERVIATGGVGVVIAARHLQLGETVALKFLLPQADRDATDVARFVREAQSAVKLKNEHVARVLDVGTLEDGSPFMVMEYLDGQDLDHVLRHRGPLTIPDAVGYVMQACEAIAEAHHLGIVHRDLKPSNFFLTARTDGAPLIKVLDFGIAKARAELEQDVSLTKTRTVLGSPVYMSPEQIRSARSVDHRSDIWSLGVTLYELLTDQLPFDGDSITGVAAAVSTDPIAPIRSLRPEIPIGLSLVVERCLEKKAADRYQTVADFAEDLAPYGPESARYSLTRIRGALGMKTSDSGKHTQSGLADTENILATTSTLMSTGSLKELTPQQRARKRQFIIYGAVLLFLAVLGTLAFSHRGTAASPLATASAAITPSGVASATLAVPLSPPLPAAPAKVEAPPVEPTSEVAQQSATARPTATMGSNAPRKSLAAVTSANHGADSKTTQPSRPAAKGTFTTKREDDIFDTRK
jgi:serine/threonine-protein kinase